MDGLSIKAYDNPSGAWIGTVSVDSGDFIQNTPEDNKQRVSEAIFEAIHKGHGFNQRAKLMLRTHQSWGKLSSVLRQNMDSRLVMS